MTAMMRFAVKAPAALAAGPFEHGLADWLDRHQPQLLDFHQSSRHFGNMFMVFGKDGLSVRIAVDRGDVIVDIAFDGTWHGDATVDAFRRGVPWREGRRWPTFDPFEDCAGVLQALADPGLAAFQKAAAIEALTAMGFEIASA
jgi:hypothetical protein